MLLGPIKLYPVENSQATAQAIIDIDIRKAGKYPALVMSRKNHICLRIHKKMQ